MAKHSGLETRYMTLSVRPYVLEKGQAVSTVRVQEGTRAPSVSISDGLPRPKFDLVCQIAVELVTDREEEYLAATMGAFAKVWLERIREEENHG